MRPALRTDYYNNHSPATRVIGDTHHTATSTMSERKRIRYSGSERAIKNNRQFEFECVRDHQRDDLLGGIDKKSAAVPFHAFRSQPLSQFVALTPTFCAYVTRRPADSPAAGVRFWECADGSRWPAAARHASRHAETLRRPPPTFVLRSRLGAPRILSEPGSQF